MPLAPPTTKQRTKLEEALEYTIQLHKEHKYTTDYETFMLTCETCKQTIRFYIPQGSPTNQVMVEWSGKWHVPLWYYKRWNERS